MNAEQIIESLGGTAAVAQLCEVKMPSVSEWKKTGIPRARLLFLRAIRPDVFGLATKRAKRSPKKTAEA